jgi:hypothetical protein
LQGESLSPKLFTLFLEDIITLLESSNICSIKIGLAALHILLYADDMVLLAYNVADLQDKINLVEKYFTENGLVVNLQKTKVVIFKNGNVKRSKPKIFWGDNELDIVDDYVYLGVPFFSNMDYKNTTKHFVTKSKIAENQLHGLFHKSKISSLDTKLRLFESLVKSILMYCSHLWGIFSIHSFDVFYNDFLKRMLSLPRFTPNWFVRIETQCKRIESSYVKNVLYFLSKILCRDRNSLIYQCYNELRKSAAKVKMKWNWFRGLHNLLTQYNISHLLQNCDNNFDVLEFRRDVSIAMEQLSNTLITLDIDRMNSSLSNPLYKSLRTHVKVDNFYNNTLNWGMVKNVVQLRSNIPRLTVNGKSITLYGMRSYFDKDRDEYDKCTLCTRNEREDTFHVMFVCPSYNLLRRALLRKYLYINSVEDYYCFLSDMDSEKINNIFHYLQKISEVRAIWVNEFDV